MSDRQHRRSLSERLDRALIAVFLLALTAPTVDQLIRPAEQRGPRDIELRTPARRPWLPTSLRELARYPRGIEDWYVDWFGLRDKFLGMDSWIKLFVFGQSPTPTVDIGRDRWMWFTGDSSVRAFRGQLPFDQRGLADWQAMLENHARVLGEQGIAYLFAIGPNKETIYPEYLPSWWTKLGPSRYEQLAAFLGTHAKVGEHWLDLRPALLAAKAQDRPGDRVYYEYGSHWNGRGQYVAYREILSALAGRFPAVAPLPPERFNLDMDDDGDCWAREMYLGKLLSQHRVWFNHAPIRFAWTEENGLQVSRGGDPAGPRVVMFHDSFGFSILNLIAQHFSRLVCSESRYLDEDLIAREHPDLVLQVFVERVLVANEPHQDLIGGGALSRPGFEHANRTLFRLDAANAASALHAKDVTLLPGTGEETMLTLRVEHESGCVVLDRLGGNVGDLLVHLEVDSPSATRLHVMELQDHAGPPAPDAWAALAQGSNALWLRLPKAPGLRGLILVPGATGEYRLRALEVREPTGG
jgi:hypothetical protein